MEMQDLLQRYFGTPDLAQVDPVALPAGIDRMRVDFGLETELDRERCNLESCIIQLEKQH